MRKQISDSVSDNPVDDLGSCVDGDRAMERATRPDPPQQEKQGPMSAFYIYVVEGDQRVMIPYHDMTESGFDSREEAEAFIIEMIYPELEPQIMEIISQR